MAPQEFVWHFKIDKRCNNFLCEKLILIMIISCITAPPVASAGARLQASQGDEAVELPCPIQGSPKPNIRWHFDGTFLSNSLDYRIASNNSLFIAVMLPQLAGTYTCLATNVLGTTAATVALEYTGNEHGRMKGVGQGAKAPNTFLNS